MGCMSSEGMVMALLTYSTQVAVLLVGIYLAPALAIAPRLLLSPATAIAIPIVSIAVISLITPLIEMMAIFDHTTVVVVTILFTLCTFFRVVKLRTAVFDWPTDTRWILAFSALISLFFAVKLGIRPFDIDDEIYSWNLWALQHLFGVPIDYSYTQAIYPQLFPRLIAYGYALLGDMELQLPVRFLFGLFPFCAFAAVGLGSRDSSSRQLACWFIITMSLIFGIGVDGKFSLGLADPLMVAALTLSVLYYIRYIREPSQVGNLILTVVCGFVAAFTRQQALIWPFFSFPLLVWFNCWDDKRRRYHAVVASLLFAGVSLIWVTGEGSGFYHNPGAMQASMGTRDLLSQSVHFMFRFFIKRPLIPLLLFASAISVFAVRRHRDIFIILLLPLLGVWMIVGAYDLRHGLPLFLLAALLLAATDYTFRIAPLEGVICRGAALFDRYKMPVAAFVTVGVIIFSGIAIHKRLVEVGAGFSLSVGGKNTIYKYFGKEGRFIYDNIYGKSNLVLWIPSNYIYGIFYGHNNIVRPDHSRYTPPNSAVNALKEEIRIKNVDYLFYPGDSLGQDIASISLLDLVDKQCPDAFELVAGPNNLLGYRVYRLKREAEALSRCK